LIRLPVSLSIIHSIVFNSGRYTLSVPTSVVNSVDRLDDLPNDEAVAAFDLKDLLGIEDGKKAVHVLKLRPPSKYVESDEDMELSLLVDDIVGNKPLMVMPVGELLAKAKLFAGVGIMENGEISILLDIESLPKTPVSHKQAADAATDESASSPDTP
jgi:two-component system chemotaxis sensor kinase CheA